MLSRLSFFSKPIFNLRVPFRCMKTKNDIDFEKMTPEQLKEDELGSKLMSVIEGTEFDRKMDEMFSKMLSSGMSE